MKKLTLRVNAADNIIVALSELSKGTEVDVEGQSITLVENIPAKFKFAQQDFAKGDALIMYGVQIGVANEFIAKGAKITIDNISHATEKATIKDQFDYSWNPPLVNTEQYFQGYHREDGKVGTRNVWLVMPLVFCENRNILAIQKALEPYLQPKKQHNEQLASLIAQAKSGDVADQILSTEFALSDSAPDFVKPFENVDGVKYLTHHAGCGGTRADGERLCRLLVGYLMNPNVGGATILSLGCQNAQVSLFKEVLEQMAPGLNKPVYIHEQQQSKSEKEFLAAAIKSTIAGLSKINKIQRKPAPVSDLVIGMECGGSDGFSGLSANPLLGRVADRIVALGGSAILAEFPELNGVEQNIIDRCINKTDAESFQAMMKAYGDEAEAKGSGFAANPSPGNIRDGLVTDAMKSAGAAKKGGEAPIVEVLDYTEQVTKKGLSLVCTPGNDVESTTALVGSGATVVLFSTGLGTPTGNPATPVLKVSSNSEMSNRMQDIIDFDAGTIISGVDTLDTAADRLLQQIINVASGTAAKAEVLQQDDFIPWRRDLSL
ncbi:altronate dehydratase family protein [Persicobacter psychrovividus]|uniref:Dehydratase n=1 Tax=Persicobacter psychrovividus TaxID=387638 RepID=A0ABN6LK86_9BACT|nr:dehydratase [Persicobacter psychrovividus]